MPGMNSFQLESEIGKMTRAMMTRSPEIGKDLISYLRTQMTLESVAGVMLVSIERVIWFDTDSVVWSIKHLIPADVMQEIKKIMTVTIYKQLINKGFLPGKDLSVDADGKLLVSHQVRKSMLFR